MSQTTAQSRRSLELGLAVRPAQDCPVRNLSPDVKEVRHHAHEDGLQCEIVCADPESKEEETFHGFNDDQDCPATIFMEYDSVPDVKRVEDDSLLIVTHPPSRGAVQDLLEDLQSVSDTVEIKWLSDTETDTGSAKRAADLDALTEKQLDAIELAVESGYYAQPRETTITDLAATCDISQSAMSQRLHTAERKLLESIFQQS